MTTTMTVSMWDTEFTIKITSLDLAISTHDLVDDGTLHWVVDSERANFWGQPREALADSVSPQTYVHFLATGPLKPEDPASYLRFLAEIDPLDISSPNREVY